MNKVIKKNEPNISIIISVLIALVLWIYVIGEVDPNVSQRFNNIPVKINNLQILKENGLVLAEDEDYSVDISVYGRTTMLYGLRNKVSASIDISNITEKGTYNVKVNVAGIPDNVQLEDTMPMEISLKVDKISNDEKDIDLNIQGEPEDGLTVLDFATEPSKVRIHGPEEILKSVNKVIANIDIKGATDDVNKSIELYAVDDNNNRINGIEINSSKTQVMVRIGKTKTIEIQADITGEPANGYIVSKITVEPSEITIGGKQKSVDSIQAVFTEPINIENIDNNLEKNIELILPKGISILNGKSTVLVKVEVEVQKIETREFNINKIDIINEPDNTNIKFQQENNILVILEGKKVDLDQLTQEKIILTVDVANVKVGENTLAIKMNPIADITLKSITPEDIVVLVESRDN